jgi:hypothetical protein
MRRIVTNQGGALRFKRCAAKLVMKPVANIAALQQNNLRVHLKPLQFGLLHCNIRLRDAALSEPVHFKLYYLENIYADP